MIRQFEIYSNPFMALRKSYPFICVLQSDSSSDGFGRLVAFMGPEIAFRNPAFRVMPRVVLDEERYLIVLPTITSVRESLLKRPVASAADYRDAIVRGIDWLFTGT